MIADEPLSFYFPRHSSLHLDNSTADWLLNKPSSCAVLFIAAVVELFTKCVPALDSIVDSAMTWVVPIVSGLSMLSTMPKEMEEDGRRLMEDDSNWMVVAQILFVSFGILLAVVIHLTKLLIRLAGVGWLTSTLTVIETVFVTITTVAAVYIRPLSILFAFLFTLCLLKWVWRKLCKKPRQKCCANKKKEILLG